MATASPLKSPLQSKLATVPEQQPEACAAVEADSVGFCEEYHGKNARISAGGLVAKRKKQGCKEAVVMTNRPLRDSELFEVEIGSDVDGFKGVKSMLGGKGGSIRIGVTSHCPSDLWPSFPQSMKRMSSGTWMMKGDEILINGETVLALQNRNSLRNLRAGDKLALMRAPEFGGSLVIFVNSHPVGIVATGVPDDVFGFVELYGDCDRVNITGNNSIDEDCLPDQIRAMRVTMRAKDCEIRQLKGEIKAKEVEISQLNRQIEVLSRPPTPPPSLSKHKKISSSSFSSIVSRTENSRHRDETDGDKLSQISEESTRRRKGKGACCTIL